MRLTIITLTLITILNTISLGQVYVRPTSEPIERPRIIKTSSSSSAIRSFSATAYCLRGKMASGKYVFSGAVAADPRVLPLGTKIEILGMGKYVVGDTGGKIKGNIVDIWFSSCSDARKFGRRRIQLRVI